MNEVFLKVNKNHFNKKLKPLEILILSQVEEFNRNNCKCYLTNKQFAKMFSVSEPTIDSAIDKLEKLGYLKRITNVVNNNGCASRTRELIALSIKKEDFRYSF